MTDLELQSNRLQTDRLGVTTMTIYKEVNRQRQGRQPGQPEAAVSLPKGEHRLSKRSSGLWGFEAEGTAYTIKQRKVEGTKPRLYIMAEIKPQPAYVSSLYFEGADSGEVGVGQDRLSGWHYMAQAPGADSPPLFVSLWQFTPWTLAQAEPERKPESSAVTKFEPERYSITVREKHFDNQPYKFSADFAAVYSQAFID